MPGSPTSSRRMDRLWELVEKTDLTTEEILPRIRHHLENQERLEQAADEARALLALRRAERAGRGADRGLRAGDERLPDGGARSPRRSPSSARSLRR